MGLDRVVFNGPTNINHSTINSYCLMSEKTESNLKIFFTLLHTEIYNAAKNFYMIYVLCTTKIAEAFQNTEHINKGI